MFDKPSGNNNTKGWSRNTILAICLVILVACGIYRYAEDWVRKQSVFLLEMPASASVYSTHKSLLSDLSHQDILRLEGNATLKFPTSAHEIYANMFGKQSNNVRFSMKASEFSGFIKTTLCKQPRENYIPTNTEIASQYAYVIEWWRPFEAKTLERCSGSSEDVSQMIYADMTDPDTYIIYIENNALSATPALPTP